MKEKPMRLLVSKDGQRTTWRHYLQVEDWSVWTDCTDMNDSQFHNFIVQLHGG